MSRQFRSDDTSIWADKYGNGSAGVGTLSGTYGSGGVGSYAIGACSGTSGQTTLTTPNGWGSGIYYVLIHQSRGTGAGNWELNKITSITTTTSTLAYALQNTYSSGAQCILMVPYSGITISGTLTAPAWDGSSGGIVALLCNGTTTISGTVTGLGKGFVGGAARSGAGSSYGYNGEGTSGPSGIGTSVAANGNGSGAQHIDDNANYAAGGSGGGNGSAGSSGEWYSTGTQAVPGTTAGNAGLTSMVFGGGGGGGLRHQADDASHVTYPGVSGGGIFICITKNFVISGSGTVNLLGTSATSPGASGTQYTCGGNGAGGSVLIKTQTATLGTNAILASGGTGGLQGDEADLYGGAGGTGRIHLDYMISQSGSTTPTLDARQDFGLRTSTSQGIII